MAALAAAVALFAGVYALRAGDPNVGDGEGILYVLPVGLLALRFGLRGGVGGALAGFALLVAWDESHDHVALTALGYVNRMLAFVVLGVLMGAFVDRRRKLEAEVQRFYEASLQAQRRAQQQLANSARWLETKVAERTYELEDARAETLQLLAVAAEYRDDETFEHTERVGVLSADIAAFLGMRSEQVGRIREAAPLHDIGKIAIPDAILLKRAQLSAEEQAMMRAHAGLGARLLARSGAPVLQMAAVIAATHHEWWDGSGYPSGLAGERIPLVGRIVAVADVFDALTHARPYKSAWPVTQALARIERAAGSQFDPHVVDAFVAVHEAALATIAANAATMTGAAVGAAQDARALARRSSSENSSSSSVAGKGAGRPIANSVTSARP
ncbi:MAG TPA: HD domain-containing phosphohydrolase [Solirubrobacteraceae bacterium]|nr:HD domain-containing phosphohydrolase [Solirubrobacteraceae bacterium]